MKRSTRNDIASAIVALCPASFGTFTWLFYSYFSTHPTKPNVQLGFVHALNNHGSYVYLSDAESTGLVLLAIAFVIAFFGSLAIVPKDPILPSLGTPRWLTYVSGSAHTDLENPTHRLKMIFLGSFVFYLAVIYFLG